MSKEVPKAKSSVSVPEVKKTFLDDITSFISKHKYSIAIIVILVGVCVFYYIKSKQRQETPQIHHPQEFGFSDDPAYIDRRVNEHDRRVNDNEYKRVEHDQRVNEPVEQDQRVNELDKLSVSSLDTVEIGENESKILSMEDISVNKEGVVEEEIEHNQDEVSEYEVYRSGPRKGQKKEKKQPARRRRRKVDS